MHYIDIEDLKSHPRRVVFLGDSITSDGRFISYLRLFFARHLPDAKVEFIGLGIGGETVCGFAEKDAGASERPNVMKRLDNIKRWLKPEDTVLFMYGMNDGTFRPRNELRELTYRNNILTLIDELKSVAAHVYAMTPTPFDAQSLRALPDRINDDPVETEDYTRVYSGYNDQIEEKAEFILSLKGRVDDVIDVYHPLLERFARERIYNPDFVVGDGIHPDAYGHWLIMKTIIRKLFHITLTHIPTFVTDENEEDFVIERKRYWDCTNALIKQIGGQNDLYRKGVEYLEPAKAALLEAKSVLKIAALEGAKGRLHEFTDERFHGFAAKFFYFEGHEAYVAFPDKPLEERVRCGKKWIWRTEYHDAFPQTDIALLREGYYYAHLNILETYACPQALELMHRFQRFVMKEFGLDQYPVFEGFSRGGLCATMYPAKYPDCVGCIYIDAPMIDYRDRIRQYNDGTINRPEMFEELFTLFGVDSMEAFLAAKPAPIDYAEFLAQNNIPTVLLMGLADTVLPIEKHGMEYKRIYDRYAAPLLYIPKPGVGHHPHSLGDPTPIVDFIMHRSIAAPL